MFHDASAGWPYTLLLQTRSALCIVYWCCQSTIGNLQALHAMMQELLKLQHPIRLMLTSEEACEIWGTHSYLSAGSGIICTCTGCLLPQELLWMPLCFTQSHLHRHVG